MDAKGPAERQENWGSPVRLWQGGKDFFLKDEKII